MTTGKRCNADVFRMYSSTANPLSPGITTSSTTRSGQRTECSWSNLTSVSRYETAFSVESVTCQMKGDFSMFARGLKKNLVIGAVIDVEHEQGRPFIPNRNRFSF